MSTYRLTDPLGFNEEFEADADIDAATDVARQMLADWYDGIFVDDYPGGFLYVVDAENDDTLSLVAIVELAPTVEEASA